MSHQVVSQDRTSAGQALLERMVGFWVSQAISVAAKLGIADLLDGAGSTCAVLAQATKTQPDALYRLMRALASVGIFAEDGAGRFHLTPMADGLRSDSPTSLRDYAILLGEEWAWRPWGHLLHSVQSGGSAFEHVFGMQIFDYLTQSPEAGRVFDAAMTSRGNLEDQAIVAACDFRGGTIVDVGGGRGSLMAAILRSNPDARGILFDLPPVQERAAELLRKAELLDRCALAAGDFFDSVPAGGDRYLMKKIIHDWDDARAHRILANCRTAMGKKGRLLLMEQVILPGNAPSFGKLMDLQMMVQTPGGRERTEAQYRSLLADAGFDLIGITPTACPLSVIVGAPA
jgi:hypothetical protein